MRDRRKNRVHACVESYVKVFYFAPYTSQSDEEWYVAVEQIEEFRESTEMS